MIVLTHNFKYPTLRRRMKKVFTPPGEIFGLFAPKHSPRKPPLKRLDRPDSLFHSGAAPASSSTWDGCSSGPNSPDHVCVACENLADMLECVLL